MVEKIIINPDDVRAYGNIFNEKKREEFIALGMVNVVSLGNQTVNGETHEVFSVKRTDTSLTASNYTGYVGTGSLSATLKDDSSQGISSQTVTLKVNNTTLESTTNSSGVASFSLSSLPAGTYTGYLKFVGDSTYSPCDKQVTITVNKYATTLEMTSANNNLYPTQSNQLTFTLKSGNVVLNNKSIDVYQGNTLLRTITTNSNGVATTNISWNTEGTNNVYGVFEGDDTYLNKTSNNINITVTKITTTLTCSFSKTSLYPTENTTATVTLKDSSNNGISGATVKLYEGNTVKTTLTTNSSGVATSTFNYSTEGTRTLKAVFEGTTVYKNVTSSSTNVTATKKTTSIAISDVNNGVVNKLVDDDKITAQLTSNNTGLASSTLTFLFKNTSSNSTVTRTATTDSNGYATVTLDNVLVEGNYTVTVTYATTTVYKASTATCTLKVDKRYVLIQMGSNSYSKTYYGSTTISARVGDVSSGQFVAMTNKNVKFTTKVGNANVTQTATTDSNGYATWTLGSGSIAAGTYTVTVSYAGTSVYKTASNTCTLTVGTISTQIFMDISTSVYVGSGTLSARLTYNDGTASDVTEYVPLANQTITFKRGNTNTSVTTDSQGIATLDVSSLSIGTYSISAVFAGSGNYAATTKSGTLIVSAKKVITIDIDDHVYINTKDTVTQIPVRLKTGNVGVANKELYYESSYGLGTVTTDSKGYANLSVLVQTEQNFMLAIEVSADNVYEEAHKRVGVHVWDYVLTAELIQVVQGNPILLFKVLYRGVSVDGIPVTITYPNGDTVTIESEEEGILIEDGYQHGRTGDYVASYQGYSTTFTF